MDSKARGLSSFSSARSYMETCRCVGMAIGLRGPGCRHSRQLDWGVGGRATGPALRWSVAREVRGRRTGSVARQARHLAEVLSTWSTCSDHTVFRHAVRYGAASGNSVPHCCPSSDTLTTSAHGPPCRVFSGLGLFDRSRRSADLRAMRSGCPVRARFHKCRNQVDLAARTHCGRAGGRVSQRPDPR